MRGKGFCLLLVACAAEEPLATDVVIDQVLLGQNSGVLLAQDGMPVTERLQPVVAGRDARLRVRLTAEAARQVELVWTTEAGEVRRTVAVEEGRTTVALDVPGDLFQEGASYRLQVLEADGIPRSDATDGGQLPIEGTAALGVREVPPLRVRLVGLIDDGPSPDLSEAHQQALSDRLFAMFPVPGVELDVRNEPLVFDRGDRSADALTPTAQALADLHRADGAPPELIYLGLYDSATPGGGVAMSSDLQIDERTAVAPATRGAYELGDNTAAHEIGHLLGILHAPCNVQVADPDFPQRDGTVGNPVWDGLDRSWRPASTGDLMGYCQDRWTSPYTGGQMAEGLLWSW